MFVKNEKRFRMHKPHPSNVVKAYMIRNIISFLQDKEGL